MTSSFTWKQSGLAAACTLALGMMSGAARAQTAVEQPSYLTDALSSAAAPAIEKVVLDADALFDFDKAELSPAGRAALDDFVVRLRTITPGMIRLVGHADRQGSDAYNQILSEDRAEEVKDYLVGKGIDPNRVRAEGKGASQPVTKAGACDGGRSVKVIVCRQPDRRVVIEVAGTRTIESNWKDFKSHAKQHWSKLSDEQLDGTAGKRDWLSGKMQEAYGIGKLETEKQVPGWQARRKEAVQPK
jgi:OOP family OmpA-OmpF porin